MTNYIPRALESVVKKNSEWFPVVLLTGQRQTGKTTMLKRLIEEGTPRNYVSLDDWTERALAQKDPELFLQLHKPPILIDEVQYAPGLFTYIKIYVDSHPDENGMFWLTSSQKFELMRGVQESLAGRVSVLNLTALSGAEIDRENRGPFVVDIKAAMERMHATKPADVEDVFARMVKGGMPSVIVKNIEPDVYYSSYLSTYIEKDIKAFSESINPMKFLAFLTTLAARCSQLLNIASIARDAEINQKQASDWLDMLRALGMVFLLHPYSNNLLKRLIKAPKVYFYDTGFVSYLTKWSSAAALQAGAMSGAALENYVVSEIAKSYLSAGKTPPMYYYRDKEGNEIDLILEHDGILNPIEIKKTANPSADLIRAFTVLDKGSLKRGSGAIICMKPQVLPLDRENFTIPVWAI